ncbi:histidinol-phosphate transaminase [Persicirhabdus sediminis]|uniref:Histidinol-phosphate aminotransferase n=1 Tax=Persicirhabdus sediminis TaxID=454144 RepID=A0A8J7MBV9_9BACT|nr:histidinol-phosphate transaminase [Persicirhabdus sediminis]MBK1790146.1 histidinol-phosphate transaminase [Persicirhabdus sediminis]
MTTQKFANQFVCDLVAYEPGKPIEETARELGLDPDSIVKLASNENSLGPAPLAKKALCDMVDELHIYPDGGGYKLRSALAEKYDLGMENIVLGNGSNEIIELLCHCYLNRDAELIAAEHAFVVYKLMATLFGAKYVEVADPDFIHDLDGMADAITENTRLVFVANPNNPTGTMVTQAQLDAFVDRLPEHVVAVFDEAYFEFVHDAPDTVKYIREGKNVVVLRTFSKAYGLAGLRIGYGLCAPQVAGILQKARQPFNTNAAAQEAALASLADTQHVADTIAMNDAGLAFYEKAFDERGLEYVKSYANFVLVNVGDGDKLFADMLKQGVIVRAMSGYKLPGWVRISVGTEAENTRCIEVLDQVLDCAKA